MGRQLYGIRSFARRPDVDNFGGSTLKIGAGGSELFHVEQSPWRLTREEPDGRNAWVSGKLRWANGGPTSEQSSSAARFGGICMLELLVFFGTDELFGRLGKLPRTIFAPPRAAICSTWNNLATSANGPQQPSASRRSFGSKPGLRRPCFRGVASSPARRMPPPALDRILRAVRGS